ncbi:hypothetical protein D3C81_2100740 [compost metagenome]
MYGCSAVSFTVAKVSDIMNKVRNKASPTSTWFGGICCVPSEVLTKPSTITIRVKLVIRIRNAGATLRTVVSSKIDIELVPPVEP